MIPTRHSPRIARPESAGKRRCAWRSRRGVTLFEVLLVAAILAVIAGLSMPSVLGRLAENSLKDDASKVRQQLAGCAVKAADSGLVYQFRYEPGGRRYAVLPFERPDAGSAGRSSGSEDEVAGQSSNAAAVHSGMLSTGVRFGGGSGGDPGNAEAVSAGPLPSEWLSLLSDGDTLGDVAWSAPVLFYPNGTATNDRLVLESNRDQRIRVSIRSLTASVTTSSIEAIDRRDLGSISDASSKSSQRSGRSR